MEEADSSLPSAAKSTSGGVGTEIIMVTNLDLAVCLLSVGIPLQKKPPYTYFEGSDGGRRITFHFHSSDADGQFSTGALIKAYSQDAKFIAENPLHPFTFAMCAVKNLYAFKRHFLKAIPHVGLVRKKGQSPLFIEKGSKKHKQLLMHGYHPIDDEYIRAL